ncbi:hypothetical protein BH23GEM3_BH23GEM3_10320 [soil metagenome]|nr:hypothetical protein [Gemmatimonadota bacterium]
MDIYPPLVIALSLALTHLLADHIHSVHRIPRNVWTSFAGGTGVAFVFMHLVPDLTHAQNTVEETVGQALGFLNDHTYLAGLVGLAVYYGVEHTAASRTSRGGGEGEDGGEDRSASPMFFWTHIGLFALFNGAVGYLLMAEDGGWAALIPLWLALSLHFLTNDYALSEHHPGRFHRIGRWILAASVLAGWAVARFFPLPPAVFALLLGFITGALILNTLKEELPGQRESHYPAFLLGAGVYTGLMLLL